MANIDYFPDKGDPWTVYRALLDLAGLPEHDARVRQARAQMLAHPLVAGLVDELRRWPGIVISSHKSAGQLYHKLVFLADLGLTRQDNGLDEILSRVTGHLSAEGLCQLPMNILEHFGGSGQDDWAWALCDAPLLLYALMKMDPAGRPAECEQGAAFLTGLARANGWPCAVSRNLGKFRGPGRKDDPCPYATLVMLKLLSLSPEGRESQAAQDGVASLLDLWQNSRERHPYQFYMGTDFRKLKAPLIWYDILHVADVLSLYPETKADPRFADLRAVILAKAGADGRYTPESVWTAWKDWEFGQKKEPSPWLTLLVDRIGRRCS